MAAQSSTNGKRMIEPAKHCQDSIIYLLHPNGKLIIPLLRGGVEKMLRERLGYTEVSKTVYDGAQDDRR